MGQHWHVCSTTYGSPHTVCMETVVTEYQLVLPYYGTPQFVGKEMSLSCDFSLYYNLPKSDPSVVY